MCPTTGGSVSPQNLQMKGGNGQKGEQVSYFIPEWSWCIGCIERKGIAIMSRHSSFYLHVCGIVECISKISFCITFSIFLFCFSGRDRSAWI